MASMLDDINQRTIRLEERFTNMASDLVLIKSALCGDGSDGKPGLIKDVDRLQQTEKRRKAIFGALGTSVVGLFAERVWHFVIK